VTGSLLSSGSGQWGAPLSGFLTDGL
jgi:hypothetical protein